MQSQKYYPLEISGAALDACLAKGWFRMGQSIFTTHFLRFQERFYPAVWLRYALKSVSITDIDCRLKKIEQKFFIEVRPLLLTEEQEALFTLYRNHSGLSMAESLRIILLDGLVDNVFPSLQVTIRDGEKLIAFGVFDVGAQSAAGISNIYHPDYSKYSLGKILMLTKIRYCINFRLKWFYPGYAVPGYKRFDYKLGVFPKKIQYFHSPLEQWLDYDPSIGLPDYFGQMTKPMAELGWQLRQKGLPANMVMYPAFDFALVDEYIAGVLTAPVFLLISYDEETEISTIVLYNLVYEGLCIATCKPLSFNGWGFENNHFVCYDVLKVIEKTEAIFSIEEILQIVAPG